MTARKFRVYLSGVASTVVTVTVDAPDGADPDEIKSAALDAAYRQGVRGLCHQCASHMDAPDEWHAGGWTMGPEDLTEYVEPAE